MRLALFRGFRIAVDQHDVEPGERADISDAGAHEAGAEHADLFQRLRRNGRTPRALVELLHRDEQRADHRRRFRRAENFGEPARFDAQRLIDRQLQTLIDDLQDGARGRIIVVGLAPVDGVRRREHHHAGLGIDRAARQLEAVDVPRRFGRAAGLDPVLRRFDQIAVRHHGVDELHRLGAIELQLIALEQKLQRVGRRQHARDALRAAGAGEQADLDLGQAEPGAAVVGGDAVMAGERQLETAAHRGAVDRRDPRLAAGLDAAAQQRQFAALLEQPRIGRFLALRRDEIGEMCGSSFPSIVRSAPAQNVSLPEVMTTPLTAPSVASSSTIADSSSVAAASMTFIVRPGAFQVTSAMPSPSMSSVKLAKVVLLSAIGFAVLVGVTHALIVAHHHQVDVGIVDAFMLRARADFQIDGVAVARLTS